MGTFHETDWSSDVLDLCSVDAQVRFSAWPPDIRANVFRGFLKSLQEDAGIISRLGHYIFLPSPSQFIIYPSPNATRIISILTLL